MQNTWQPEVTVSIVSYNRKRYIDECIACIAAQDYKPAQVLLVDNGSTDGTLELVREKYPWVEVVVMGTNRGPNPARNQGLLKAQTELVLLVDDDAALAPDCLSKLVAAIRSPQVGAVAPLAVFYNQPDTVQYGGADIHFVGAAITRGGPLSEFTASKEPYQVAAMAGVALLIRKAAALEIGLFDEELFFGWTDGEFTSRLTLAGHRCLQVPSAIARHNVQPRGTTKVFYQVHNRWRFMLRLYSARTLLLIAPMLVLYELSLFVLLTAKGHLRDYLRANLELLRALPAILRKRRRTQALRRIPDSAWLTVGVFQASQAIVGKGLLARLKNGINDMFDGYWLLVRRLV